MSTDALRKMLYAARVPVSFIADENLDLSFENCQFSRFNQSIITPTTRLTKKDIQMLDGMQKIITADDVVYWIDTKIRSQLQVVGSFKEESWQILSLLRASLCECLLSEFFEHESLFPVLEKQYAYLKKFLSLDVRKNLEISYKTQDIRSIILNLSEEYFKIDGRVLLSQLELKFPERSTQITPEIIRSHQSSLRPTQYWFYNSLDGEALFLIFYTKSCAFTQCSGCNLHLLGASDFVKSTSVIEQVNQIFDKDLLDSEKRNIREIVLSNNGSVFDKKTFSVSALLYFCTRVTSEFPKLNKLIIETRVEYVTQDALELIKEALSESGREIKIELAIGVEIFDEKKRNSEFHKGLSNKALHGFVEMSGELGFGVRCYFMYKSLPGMTVDEANKDIADAVLWLDEMVNKFGSSITMHLNPTYVAVETSLEAAFKEGRYTPPTLMDIKDLLLSLPLGSIGIYIGLNDEGLAVEGGSFMDGSSEDTLLMLKAFNRTQDKNCLL